MQLYYNYLNLFGEWGSSSSLTIAVCFLMLAHQFYNHKWEKSIEFLFISRKQRNGLFSLTDKRADKKAQFSCFWDLSASNLWAFPQTKPSADYMRCRYVVYLLRTCYAARVGSLKSSWEFENCIIADVICWVTTSGGLRSASTKKKIIVSRNSKKRRGRH